MHYSCEVTVDLPRDRVLELLSERCNDMAWRADLTLCEQIVGEPGQPGTQTRLIYVHKGERPQEWMERVTANRLPDEIELALVSPKIEEHQTHRFVAEGESVTRWIVESEVDYKHLSAEARRRSHTLEANTCEALMRFKSFAEARSRQFVQWRRAE